MNSPINMAIEKPTSWCLSRAALAWLPLLVLPGSVILLVPADWPRWAFMWSLALSIYVGCKWLTLASAQVATSRRRRLGYMLAWPGMDAVTFLDVHLHASRPAASDWLLAVLNLIAGGALFWGVPRLIPADMDLLRGWVGMAGIVFVLHFGLFQLLSYVWRWSGVRAMPLMNLPILATSVSDFWGRRWNTAFRDLTHRFLFRPLAVRIGPRWSIAVGFLFSGLVHDLVISVPAGGGYGLPTLFFVIQAAGLLFERSGLGKRLGLMHGWRGWLFTMVVLIFPAGFLFHPPFVRTVILPFMECLGS